MFRHVSRSVKYQRRALPLPGTLKATPPWQMVLNGGGDVDFLMTTNLTRNVFLNALLPAFEKNREYVNYGSPFRNTPKTRGRNPLLASADLAALDLRYIRSPGYMYENCTFFGICPSSISEWLDYSLLVMRKTVTGKDIPSYEIRWPNEVQMRASARLLEKKPKMGTDTCWSVCSYGRRADALC